MVLDFKNVSFSYDRHTCALDKVSIKFEQGVHLLLGPNSAGKSTLLKIGAGLLEPQIGKCYLDKEVMACHDPHAVKHVFMLSDSMHFPLPTIADMARLHAPFYPNFSAEVLDRNLKAFSLSPDMRLADLSLGNRRKAHAAYVLALGTEVLLLDEPANGLDMASKEVLTSLIVETADRGGASIIVATHTVQEMRNIFDTVTILNIGHIALSASIPHIMDSVAFISDPVRRPDALFFKEGIDGPNQIVPASEALETPVDFRLLYLAATSLPHFTSIDRALQSFADTDNPCPRPC